MQDSKILNKTNVHFVLPAILSIFGLAVSLIDVYDFKPNVWDFGLFINVMWNFASGNGWYMSFFDGIRHSTNYLADHFNLLIPVFSWLLKLFPSTYTYSCLHNLAFAAVFFLVPCLVKEIYQQAGKTDYLKSAAFLLLATCLFPGIIGAWRYQSHSTTLAMPFLLLALIFLHQKKNILVVICCILVAMAQERAVVAVFGVGMYAVLLLKQYRLGLALCTFSTGYFFLLVKVIIPWFAGNQYMYSSSLAPLFAPDKKIYFLLKCLAGWMFLLCIGKRAAIASLCALPLIAIGLVSSRESMFSFSHHYQDLPTMFMIAGATYGMLRLQETDFFKKIPGKVCLLAATVFFGISIACFFWFNPVYRLATRGDLAEIHELNQQLEKYYTLPQATNIYVSTGIGSRFALRERVYHITPENAANEMQNAVVVISPKFGMYPYDENQTNAIFAKLRENKSVQEIRAGKNLYLFATKDIDNQFRQ